MNSQTTTRIALISSLVYIISHLIDITTTYILSPDLRREANIMISQFDFGWNYIFVSAALTSLVMVIGQLWAWKTLVKRFPDRKLGYAGFYHQIMQEARPHFMGSIVSLVIIILYSIIAAKILTVLWHLSLLTDPIYIEPFHQFLLIKNLLASLFGLYVFFIHVYLLHRKHC